MESTFAIISCNSDLGTLARSGWMTSIIYEGICWKMYEAVAIDTASLTNCLRCNSGLRMNFRVRIVTGDADMMLAITAIAMVALAYYPSTTRG